MYKERGIYKYVDRDTGEIIYIGKSNSSIKSRINSHKRETKFLPYIGRCDVFIITLHNNVEIDILERALINKYKPKLNEIDVYPVSSNYIKIDEPEWNLYIEESRKRNISIKKSNKKIKTKYELPFAEKFDCVCDLKDAQLYIYNTNRNGHFFEDSDEAKQFLFELVNTCDKYGEIINKRIYIDWEYICKSKIVSKTYIKDSTLSICVMLWWKDQFTAPEFLADNKDLEPNAYKDIIKGIYFIPETIKGIKGILPNIRHL